ncbi:MAG: hypothetical protein E7070_08555 [Bacteroidales bacterium]|nr:hypothetical protein [Bacteroidales bacterium]
MRFKTFLSAIAISMVATSMFAQITTGEPTAKKIQTGNRAEEGDWGIYLGASTSMFKDFTDGDIDVEALPLINFKHMLSDEVEARLGLKIYRTKEKMKGKDSKGGDKFFDRHITSEYFFYPGLAYHFDKSNLLDVYGGVDLPIGITRDSYKEEYGGVETSKSLGQFHIGVGAFIGLQAYVANLPVAVGLEYGISTMLNCGNKWEIDDGTDTYYTEVDGSYQFKELSKSDSKVGNEVRVTISYFFK